MAFTIAAASISEEKAPKAIMKIFAGVSAGMVLSVPVIRYIASCGMFIMLFNARYSVFGSLIFLAVSHLFVIVRIRAKRAPKLFKIVMQ